jgi:hypothetical protein
LPAGGSSTLLVLAFFFVCKGLRLFFCRYLNRRSWPECECEGEIKKAVGVGWLSLKVNSALSVVNVWREGERERGIGIGREREEKGATEGKEQGV